MKHAYYLEDVETMNGHIQGPFTVYGHLLDAWKDAMVKIMAKNGKYTHIQQ